MNMAPFIERLKEVSCGTFRQIGGAAEYDRAQTAMVASPAVFVLEMESFAGEVELISVVEQNVRVRVSVLIASQFAGDSVGPGTRDSMNDLRNEVKSALLGWVHPDANGRPVTYEGGRLLDFIPGTMWWEETYITETVVSTR